MTAAWEAALRSAPARAAAFLIKCLGVLSALCALTLGGGLYWLRTPSAEKLILNETAKVLAARGMTFTAASLSGPLPQRLSVENIFLADAHGPILRAERAELRWSMASLLSGMVLVEAVELDRPELFRLPVFPPAPEKAEETPPENSAPFSLPVEIRLDSLRLRDGRIHTAALKAEAGPDSPVIALAVSGSATAGPDAVTAALRLDARYPKRGGLSLDLRLEQPSGQREDALALSIAADEGPGGVLSLLLDRPDLPAYSLRLDGAGGLKDWRAKLALLAGRTKNATPANETLNVPAGVDARPGVQPDVLDLSAELGLGCATGSLLNDLVARPAFNARLTAEARPGERTPASLLPLLGETARADLEFSVAGTHYDLKAEAGTDAWLVRLSEVEIRPDGKPDSLAVKADLQALLRDPAAFAGRSGPGGSGGKRGEPGRIDPPPAPFPLQNAALTASLSGSLGAAGSRLTMTSTLKARTADHDFAIPCILEAEANGQRLSLRRLSANGLGITAEATADIDNSSGAVRAAADILAADRAEWQILAARLAGFARPSGQVSGQDGRPEEQESAALGGELRLNASLDLPGRAPAVNGESPAVRDAQGEPSARLSGRGLLRLTGNGMRWPTARLTALLGSSLDLSARLGSLEQDGQSWTVVLEEARAGIFSASGRAALIPPAGRLEARLKADLADLAPLGAGLGGALSAEFAVSGPLNALDVRAVSDSPALSTANGVFRNLSLRLDAHSAMPPVSPSVRIEGQAPAALDDKDAAAPDNISAGGKDLALRGNLALRAADSPGGPISLSGGWRADLPADGRTLRASLRDFLFQGSGIKVSASLDGRVALSTASGQGAATGGATSRTGAALPVFLTGEVGVDVNDWGGLAALSGAPLSGGPARMRLRLDDAGGGQAAALDLTLQSLLLRDMASGRTAFSLSDVSAAINLPRLDPGKGLTGLAPDFRLRLGPGLAGPLHWSGGAATVRGQDGAGEFSLVLNRAMRAAAPAGTGQQGRRPAKAGGSRPGASGATDLLDLRGGYNLVRQEATFNALTLSVPAGDLPARKASTQNNPDRPDRSGADGSARGVAGLRLRKPLTVKFSDGVRFTGLDLAFQPGGRLSAEAAIAPGLLRLKADLQALPFSFFALFTEAPLPGGELRLLADASSSAQGPRGTVTLQSRITSSRPQGGPAGNSVRTGEADRAGRLPSGTSAPAFDLNVTARLSASPGSGVAPGSGVRPLPGHIWLAGSGNFGRASAENDAREGRLAFQIPLRLSPDGAPLPDGRAPLAASVHWDGSIDSLWQAVPLPDLALSGKALLDLAVTGSMDAPKPALKAYFGQGRLEDIANGILLTDIRLEAGLTPDGNLKALLSAGDGQQGTLALEALLRGLLDKKPPLLAIRGQLDNLRPLHRDDLSIALSGLFSLKGPADTPAITADIQVDQGEFTLSSAMGGSVTTLEISEAEAAAAGAKRRPKAGAAGSGKKGGTRSRTAKTAATPASGPSLDARISLPGQFFIRGLGMDSEWEGELRISGPPSDPSLTGALRPVRGQFDILSKTFAFTGGDISFTGGMRINPLLNLELTYEGTGATAIVRAMGSARKPQLILESRPPMPRDEILAQVLFGKRATDLSRFEALQLANSLRELSNAGGSSLDVLTGLRKNMGLDVLRVGSQDKADQRSTSGQSGDGDLDGPREEQDGTASAPTLEAGKYINDSTYIGVEQGTTPDSTAVRVEVELFPSVNLQGRSSSTASEVGVGWKKDY